MDPVHDPLNVTVVVHDEEPLVHVNTAFEVPLSTASVLERMSVVFIVMVEPSAGEMPGVGEARSTEPEYVVKLPRFPT